MVAETIFLLPSFFSLIKQVITIHAPILTHFLFFFFLTYFLDNILKYSLSNAEEELSMM